MDKFYFSEKFENQLRRATNGYAPWKMATADRFKARAMESKAPSEKQVALIMKLGGQVPDSMSEASRVISELLGK